MSCPGRLGGPKNGRKKKHFVLLSLSVYGHLIPMLALARTISRFHKVTLVVSHFILEHARKKGLVTPEFEQEVEVHGLEDGIPSGLSEKEAFQQSGSKSPDYRQFLRDIAFAQDCILEEDSGILGLPADVVIGDAFLANALRTCATRNIAAYLFGSFSLAFFVNYFHVVPETPTGAIKVFESFPIIRPLSEGPQQPVSERFKQRALEITSALQDVQGLIFNSVRESEVQALHILATDKRTAGLEIYCVGPVMSFLNYVSVDHDGSVSDLDILSWLDQQAPASVIYVSFGTNRVLKENRIRETAKALMLLRAPFIFVLQKEYHQYLPEEFQEYLSANTVGIVSTWAPQKSVLAHPSVRLSISHCGWNSTNESIYFGKPIVAWPTFGDQLENALWIERIGVGLCVFDEESKTLSSPKSEITAERVVDVFSQVLTGDFSVNAQGWRKRMREAIGSKGSSYRELVKFMDNCENSGQTPISHSSAPS